MIITKICYKIEKHIKIQMIEQGHSGKSQFIALVKIRIGEPLTAIQIDENKVIFGSISGYIGYYDLELKKTHYYEPINEEIIRGIYSQDHKLYFAIGDRHVLIKDLKQQRDQRINIVRAHTNNICSHTMTMMQFFVHFPLKRDRLYVKIIFNEAADLEQEKNNLYEINIQKNEVQTHRQFKIPEIYVPFDFDGRRILWMEYKEGGVKQFQCYDLAKKQITTVRNFGDQYRFLSFGRILEKEVIFIENNKNVKLLNTQNNTILDLYSHQSSIIAFDVADRDKKYFRLISVDFNGIYKQWKNNVVTQNISLWNTKNAPEAIKKHHYLFDMGYPYYMKAFGNIVAITTDLGLCIFRI